MHILVRLMAIFTLSSMVYAGSIKNTCFENSTELSKEHFEMDKSSNFHLGKSFEENLDVSIVSLSEAKEIFEYLKSKSYIPFDYEEVGCEARAHEMARIMDSMCLNSAKAFLIGDISFKGISWQHHVAPMLLVRDGQTITPYIFDPSVSKELITLSKWSHMLKNGRLLGYYKLKITNQFTYMPDDYEEGREKYRFKDTVKTKLGLGLFKSYETAQELPEDFIKLLKKVIK